MNTGENADIVIDRRLIDFFGDLSTACFLSMVQAETRKLQAAGEDGWFGRTFDEWESFSGINATKVREISLALEKKGFLEVEQRRRGRYWVTHFKSNNQSCNEKFPWNTLSGPAVKIPKDSVGTCPQCGGKIVEGEKAFFCTKKTNPELDQFCDFKIFKSLLDTWGGQGMVTAKAISDLLHGKDVVVNGLVGKKGKLFSCKLKIESAAGSKKHVTVGFAHKGG